MLKEGGVEKRSSDVKEKEVFNLTFNLKQKGGVYHDTDQD
jgi:hypothetical protein